MIEKYRPKFDPQCTCGHYILQHLPGGPCKMCDSCKEFHAKSGDVYR